MKVEHCQGQGFLLATVEVLLGGQASQIKGRVDYSEMMNNKFWSVNVHCGLVCTHPYIDSCCFCCRLIGKFAGQQPYQGGCDCFFSHQCIWTNDQMKEKFTRICLMIGSTAPDDKGWSRWGERDRTQWTLYTSPSARGKTLEFSMRSNKESIFNRVQRQESVHLKTSWYSLHLQCLVFYQHFSKLLRIRKLSLPWRLIFRESAQATKHCWYFQSVKSISEPVCDKEEDNQSCESLLVPHL